MKKIIPALALIGGAAAFVIYKMKQEEKKQIIDLDQGLLDDDVLNDEIEEGPISDPMSCCEETKEVIDNVKKEAKNIAETVKDTSKEIVDDCQTCACENASKLNKVFDEGINLIKNQSKKLMDQMAEKGDVHEHERPVQHQIKFVSIEDMENFRNDLINKGFVVTNGDIELELYVLHISPIDEDKLMKNVIEVANAAKNYHGEYMGWSSKIIY